MRAMTVGSPAKHIITFALPMLLGNLFQQLYNAVDSLVVGRYVGKNALAALGTSSAIMNVVLFIVVGGCLGASILMAERYGAQDEKGFKEVVSTALLAGGAITLLLSAICVFLAKPLLLLIRTPEEVVGEASLYLQTIFAGLLFAFLYNILSSALRAMGDSKTPLIFLILSAVLNMVLDVLFVATFSMGVFGAAFATVLAQFISALLCLIYIYWKIPLLALQKKELVLKKGLLRPLLGYSWSTAFQQAFFFFGKTLIQGAINPLGVDAIAAFNAVSRVEGFIVAPTNSMAGAITTFTAQNKGADKLQRIHPGFKAGVLANVGSCIAISIAIYCGASFLMDVFVPEGGAATAMGVGYLHFMAIFFPLAGVIDSLQGFFRGFGNLKITIDATFLQLFFRVGLSYLLAHKLGITAVAVGVAIGWVLMFLYEGFIYLRNRKTGLY